MKKQLFYKIVNLCGESDPVNCYNPFFLPIPGIYYQVGEWTEAPEDAFKAGYGLCVFDTLPHLRDYLSLPTTIERVFLCEVRGIMPELPKKLIEPYPIIKDRYKGMEFLLKNLFLKNHESLGSGWAEGTVMVQGVKLIKEVYF